MHMNELESTGLRTIRRALLSVSDKTGLIEFARGLKSFDIEILSTGGTAKLLRENDIEVRDVSSVTGFPEMLDGRVKTLHPRIHGGILAVRDNAEHIAATETHAIPLIDLVVIDLYPFEKTIAREGVTLEEAIEQIDIGGPAMIRSAAKNFRDVAIVTSHSLYDKVLGEIKQHKGALSYKTRTKLALNAFIRTCRYDSMIWSYLMRVFGNEVSEEVMGSIARASGGGGGGSIGAGVGIGESQLSMHTSRSSFGAKMVEFVNSQGLPASIKLNLAKKAELRYGENPHQRAALYEMLDRGIASAEILNGKEMSYNNYVDADAAWQLVCDFDEAACAIVKHTNPAGVGTAKENESLETAYRRALETDPVSAFGGIVAFNQTVDEAAAKAVTEIFTEVVVAADYTEAALEVLRRKKNLRVLRVGVPENNEGLDFKTISGGLLVQTRDNKHLTRDDVQTVTERQPTEEEIRALLFAWTVCKHTKSNAIVYARGSQTVGVGAGQMSRVDSVRLGAMRAANAKLETTGSVLASDAFFPFRDGVDEAARYGITAIIQPGGSVRDEETIAAANEHNIAMVFTRIRHFKH